MCVGEKRKLTIPSNLAYGTVAHNVTFHHTCINYLYSPGSRGFGGIIPPNSALVFETELITLEKASGREEL